MRYRFILTMAAVPVSGAGSNHGAAAAAVARLMVVAAVGHAVMDVGTGGGAAVHGAQGQALTVAVAKPWLSVREEINTPNAISAAPMRKNARMEP